MTMLNFSHTKRAPSILYSRAQNLRKIIHYQQVGTEPADCPTLHFGKDIPTATGRVHGGAVKLQRLQEHFPVSKVNCNILYLVSSSQPPYPDHLITIAKKRGVKIVWNQNGVSYPASEPVRWKRINAGMRQLMHRADYVIYQSQFCKKSADEFLERFEGPHSVIYNNIDTTFFTPQLQNDINRPLTILLGGNQYRKYRLETALKTIAEIKKALSDVQLIVTGKVAWNSMSEVDCLAEAHSIMSELNITENVQFTGMYTQEQAPVLYNRADLLLHTKWRDPSPGLVIEAMSCGLPVVYSSSGGVPELVGTSAGIGVPAYGSWEMIDPPDPVQLADAVLRVFDRLDWYSSNARKRAVEKFNLPLFIDQHKTIFEEVLVN